MKRLLQTEPSRYMSREDCERLFDRITSFASGGGDTTVTINSMWRGNLRWARNRVTTSGDLTRDSVTIAREIRGASGGISTNKFDDESLQRAVQDAERIVRFYPENPDSWPMPGEQQYLKPAIWDDTVFDMGAVDRSTLARANTMPAVEKKLLSAGYLQVGATSRAAYNTKGLNAYYAGTSAQYSVTVRNPSGTGSGWAGSSNTHWNRIDSKAISDVALDKCVHSADPKAVEPGRYTLIMEPQAVHDLFVYTIYALDRYAAENTRTVYTDSPGQSKIGQQIFDRRLTVSTDPMDPDGGYFPFDYGGYPYRPVKWVEDGVLKELAYSQVYALTQLGHNVPLPNPLAYRLSGGTSSVEKMIASTERGLLVTRFSGITVLDYPTLMMSGVSRDGLWFVEDGKIKFPVKNMRFTDSPMFVFNSILDLGVPQPVFAPGAPVVVPPVKVRDFNFSSLSDAV